MKRGAVKFILAREILQGLINNHVKCMSEHQRNELDKLQL